MLSPQIEFQQGISKTMSLDNSEYGVSATWIAALINPSTNIRYVANTTIENDMVRFTWPSGLDANLNIDPSQPNGTAHMSVGVYNLEIYTSDLKDIGVAYEAVRVVSSNLMAKNAPTNE